MKFAGPLHFDGEKHRILMSFYCYILRCADGTYYTGWTTDPERRLHQHNTGRGARYTKTRLPVQMVYVETQPDRSTAQKRENKIKKMSRHQKEALIRKFENREAEAF